MKNVLLIGSELGKGGAERSISLLSYYLQPHYNVTLCILSGKDREKFYKTCDDVVFIDPPESKGFYQKIKAWKYRYAQLKKLKKEKNIDVAISFLVGPGYINVLTRAKEKIVLSVRGSITHDQLTAGIEGKLRKKILIPWLYNKADQIVCVTNALSDELENNFGVKKEKLKTIYNFYETENIIKSSLEPLTAEEEKIFSKPVIISSGRLHVQKEFDKLIRIFADVRSKKDVRLIILGEGDLQNSLINLVQRLDLKILLWQPNEQYEEADIYLMGYQKNAFKFYHHSQLFALSSSWEGFPNVLAEALICNIPVVTTDCYTGPREILNLQNLTKDPTKIPIRTEVGILLPMVNELNETTLKIWSDEIIYLLDKPAPDNKYFTKLTQRFTLDEMLQQWKDVIEN